MPGLLDRIFLLAVPLALIVYTNGPDMSAAAAVLFMLLFVEYVACSRRCSSTCRCTHGKFRWGVDFGAWKGFGSAGEEDGNTADERRAASNCHSTTSSVEEEEGNIVQIRAWREADFDNTEENTADESQAASNCHLTTPSVEEEDNTTGDVQIRAWRETNFDCVEENIAADQSRARARNGLPKLPERSAANFIPLQENNTGDHIRTTACNGRLKLPERSAVNSVSSRCAANQTTNNVKTSMLKGSTDNIDSEETNASPCVPNIGICGSHRITSVCETLRLNCREDYCVQRDELSGWTQPSWRDAIDDDGHPNSAKEFSEHDSWDWSQEQSCLDSAQKISGQHDDSRIDRDIACSSDDSDISCNSTLSPISLADDKTMAMVLSPTTQVEIFSSDEIDSSVTEQLVVRQPDSNEDMDIYDDLNRSTTELLLRQLVSSDKNISEMLIEQVLVMQPDSHDGMDVPMAREHPTNDNDNTRSTPWWLLPGFKFVPTDLQIVVHYLKHKVLNLSLPEYHPVVEGVNVHALDADQITLDDNCRVDEEVLGFFFVLKERKRTYTNGCFHTTPDGYWKVRGRPARVKDDGGRTIAFKTSMDYYRGRPPHGCRTPWSMSEYALNADRHDDLRNLLQPWMNSYVVCKVRKREGATDRAMKSSGLLPRRFRLKRKIQKYRPMKPKTAAAARREVGEVPATLGKRKRPSVF